MWETEKRAQLLKIKARVSSIIAKGCILMTVCVCFIDMTTPAWCREKVMVYIYTQHFGHVEFSLMRQTSLDRLSETIVMYIYML